jgi:hypothetical protein
MDKAKLETWAAYTYARHGVPSAAIHFGTALGDDLLSTAVARELKLRGEKRLWMMTRHPEIFRGNSDVDAVVPHDDRHRMLVGRAKARFSWLRYCWHDAAADRDLVAEGHIIAAMCSSAGIKGPVTLRPYLALTAAELQAGRIAERQIAIQVTGRSAVYPMQNKEWFPERFQLVVDGLKDRFTILQLGSKSDPLLHGTTDLRGQTTLRQSAAILHGSRFFVGLVGFLMHLARAVDCRAAIIYGGRESPRQSGYPCNENVHRPLPCSPCWLWSTCAYDRECMRSISADEVLEATGRLEARLGGELETEIGTAAPLPARWTNPTSG